MTPTETLRAAATKLRGLASNATRGPWTATKASRRSHRVRADAHAPGALVIQYANPSDAGLISALDPIAAALTADWLEHIADESGAFYRTLDGHPALALAQYILGEDQ